MLESQTILTTNTELQTNIEPTIGLNGRCEVEVVRSDAEFDALERQWNDLLEGSDYSVFQTFEWLRTWWQYFGGDHELHCLVFRHHNEIVGIAPMFKEHVKLLRVNIAARLQFIGAGLSDYLDVIVLPGYETSVLNAFRGYLEATARRWDVIDMEDVNEKSILVQQFPQMLEKRRISIHSYQGSVCPQKPLPASWEELLQTLGPSVRNNLKRKYKRLEESFPTEVELLTSETGAIRGGIDSFSEIHGQRWRSVGYPSAFDDESHRAFHTDLAQKFASRGWLRLFFIRADDRRIAVCFNFNYRNRIYMYQCNAHGPKEMMKYSPGMLIKGIAMRRGIEEGMRLFDFMRGDESYKSEEWKSTISKNWLIRGSSPYWVSRFRFTLFLGYELLWKMIKRLQWEYYEFRRFGITRKPSAWMVTQYVGSRIGILLRLGLHYLGRHLPASIGIRSTSVGESCGRGSYHHV